VRPEVDVVIGHVPAKKQLVHHVAPGPVRFMVVSEPRTDKPTLNASDGR
jgi:hypothetical protein